MKNFASSAGHALRLLFEGNARFLKRLDAGNGSNIANTLRPADGDPSPFCIVITCSDSRVPPELIFDQSIGRLFVIRLAGNYASTSTIASIERAVLKFKIPLIVVLGHSCCGAIQAALGKELSSSIQKTVNKKPGIENNDLSVNYAAQLNIHNSIQSILESPVLHEAQKKNEVGIIGAFHNQNSGEVEFISSRTEKSLDERYAYATEQA